MHMRCRTYGEDIRELKAVVAQFQDVLAAARQLNTIDEIHTFLRSSELSLKSGNAATVRRAAQQQNASLPTDAITSRDIASLHFDGPPSVRQYTVDGPSKLAQVRAIEQQLAAVAQSKERARIAEEEKTPRYARLTSAAARAASLAYKPPPSGFRLHPTRPLSSTKSSLTGTSVL